MPEKVEYIIFAFLQESNHGEGSPKVPNTILCARIFACSYALCCEYEPYKI